MPARSFKRVVGLNGVYNSVDEIMAGQVIFCASASIPAGYLECNGAAVSRATYGTLFTAIGSTYGAGDGATTFNVPDLRGEFLRGADNGRGVDTGRALGSAQAQATQAHSHTINAAVSGWTGGSGSVTYANGNNNGTQPVSTSNSSGTETRPRNVAMVPCIKYS